MQGAAGKGGKTCAEDHSGVGEVGVGHHAGVDQDLGAVDQRCDQALRQPRLRLTGRAALRLIVLHR